MKRPDPNEYAPHAKAYVDKVPDGDLIELLKQQIDKTVSLLEGVDEEKAGEFRYQPGKWTIKEVIGHMSDTERIFAYRALRIARGDKTPLPGFDQEPYVTAADSNSKAFKELLSELQTVRSATIALFESFPDKIWMMSGKVDNLNITVRGIAFTLAGHELHHVQILQEKYLT